MTIDNLVDEVRQLIVTRDRGAIAGLAERASASEWADIIPRLDPGELAVLLQWLPDAEIPELLTELEPAGAADILRTLTRPRPLGLCCTPQRRHRTSPE